MPSEDKWEPLRALAERWDEDDERSTTSELNAAIERLAAMKPGWALLAETDLGALLMEAVEEIACLRRWLRENEEGLPETPDDHMENKV